MKPAFLSVFVCLASVLPCQAQDALRSDKFPCPGASHDVVCTDEARRTTTFTFGRIKVFAVSDNGWCRVEYDAFNQETGKSDQKKDAWINLAYLSSAVEATEAK